MVEIVKVQGLKEFSRHLKGLNQQAPKFLRNALNDVSHLVIDDARPKIPKLTGAARNSLRAVSTRTKVRVRGGGRRAPYYPWLDFGGRVGKRARTIRPFLKEGRYLYRSYYDLRDADRFRDALEKALKNAAEAADMNITIGGGENGQ